MRRHLELTITGGFLCALLSGCGLGLMQTAKTTPEGNLDINMSAGYLHNEMVEERGPAINNLPVQFGIRYGLNGHMDIGASLFLASGALFDVKYNFLRPEDKLAISLQGGLGYAYNNHTLQLPLRALISYESLGGWVTPYAGIALGTFWILDYQSSQLPEGPTMVARKGHGDGVLMATAGVEVFTNRRVKLIIEYNFLKPIFDDPGDNFSFVENHIFLAGLRF